MQARALATRRKVLDATVEALVEQGYSGTTTQEVCRRAGISRGTLQYHYPTRPELLIAALEHVLSTVVQEFLARHAAQQPAPDALIGLMWREWQGPALTAWLELAVAARTNDELREPMRIAMLRFDELVRAAFAQLVPGEAIPVPFREHGPFFIFALLNGLAVGRSYEAPGHQDGVLQLLQLLVQNQIGGPE